MRLRYICLFINLFVLITAKGQQVFTGKSYAGQNFIIDTTRQTNKAFTTIGNLALYPFGNTSIKTVSPGFYYNSIGFFCQKELQLEKALSFPVKFRLGSVAYTDEMEGKGRKTALSDKRKL